MYADFFFIARETHKQEHKFLAVVEVASGMVGVIPCDSYRRTTNVVMSRWFAEFAINAHDVLEVFSDAEGAVGKLCSNGLEDGVRVLVRKAAPQAQEAVGAVERAVRRFKEASATIRVDLREAGVDICNSYDSWFHLLKYVAFAHNAFACPGEGVKTPREALANRQLPKPTFQCIVQWFLQRPLIQ